MMIDLVGRLALMQHDNAEPSQRNASAEGISFADELSTTMTTTSTDTAFAMATLTSTATTVPMTTTTSSVFGEPSEAPTRATQARSRSPKKAESTPSLLGRSEQLDGRASPSPSSSSSLSVAARGASSPLVMRDARLASELEDLSLLAKVSRSSSTMRDVQTRDRSAMADDKDRSSVGKKPDASSRSLNKGSSSTSPIATKLEALTRVASNDSAALTQESSTALKATTTIEQIMGSLREQAAPHGVTLRGRALTDDVLSPALTREPIVDGAPTSNLRELSLMVAELQTCVAAQPTAVFVDVDPSGSITNGELWQRGSDRGDRWHLVDGVGGQESGDDIDHIGGRVGDSSDSSFQIEDEHGVEPVRKEATEIDRPVTLESSLWSGASSLAYRDPVRTTPETSPLSESVRTTVDHLRSLLPEGGRLLEVRSNFVRLELSHAAGPLQLEVMVRSGVVDVRAHGAAAAEMAWRVPELAAALQGTGMRLGAFEVQSVRRTKDSAGSGGSSGGSHTESRQKSNAPVGKSARKAPVFGVRGAG
jgi:hypothetical protein